MTDAERAEIAEIERRKKAEFEAAAEKLFGTARAGTKPERQAMTPPHTIARAMDPLAFADWSKCPPRGMEGMHDVAIRNAQTSRQRRATKLATLAWSLAIEEAAKRADDEALEQHCIIEQTQPMSVARTQTMSKRDALRDFAISLRALAVEG